MNRAASATTWSACEEFAAARDRGRERQQAPRGHVVDRGARHRERPDRPLQHPPLDQDPREHGEGGDGHRDAHEEREGQVAHVGREQLVDRQRDEEAEPHRERDARVRDERRLADPVAQDLRVELHPDQEEVEGEADLGGPGEERHDVRREEVVLGLGPDGAEQRRPEQDPRQHLAHHARLVEPRDQRADETRGQDHGGDREHQPAEGLLAAPLLRRLGRRARLGQLLLEGRSHRLPADRAGELRGSAPCRRRRGRRSALSPPTQSTVPVSRSSRRRSLPSAPPLSRRTGPTGSSVKRSPRQAESDVVEAGDRGLCILVPADQDRDRDRHDAGRRRRRRSRRSAACRPAVLVAACRSPRRRKYAIQPDRA